MNLVFEQGTRAGQVVPLDRPRITMGRTNENDLVLADHGVSRRHACIEQVPQGWTLTDLGSTNGTYVDGQRIGQHHFLQPGDHVSMGSAAFRVQPGPEVGARSAQEVQARTQAGAAPRTALKVAVAVCVIVVLVALVLLLVTLLKPEELPAQPTPVNQLEEFITALPLPTGLQDMMTAVVPLLPSGMPLLPFGPTATPEPGSGLPYPGLAGVPTGPLSLAPVVRQPATIAGSAGSP